jgi:hypothetical protein
MKARFFKVWHHHQGGAVGGGCRKEVLGTVPIKIRAANEEEERMMKQENENTSRAYW